MVLVAYAPRGLSRPVIRGESLTPRAFAVAWWVTLVAFVAAAALLFVPVERWMRCTELGNVGAGSEAVPSRPQWKSFLPHQCAILQLVLDDVVATTAGRPAIPRERQFQVDLFRGDGGTAQRGFIAVGALPSSSESSWWNSTNSSLCCVRRLGEITSAESTMLFFWAAAFASGAGACFMLLGAALHRLQPLSRSPWLFLVAGWTTFGVGSPVLFIGAALAGFEVRSASFWPMSALALYAPDVHAVLWRACVVHLGLQLAFPSSGLADADAPPAIVWRPAAAAARHTRRLLQTHGAHVALPAWFALSSLGLLGARVWLSVVDVDSGTTVEIQQPLVRALSIFSVQSAGAPSSTFAVGAEGGLMRTGGFPVLVIAWHAAHLAASAAIAIFAWRGSVLWFAREDTTQGSVTTLNLHFHQLVACDAMRRILAPIAVLDALLWHLVRPLLLPAVVLSRDADGVVSHLALASAGVSAQPACVLMAVVQTAWVAAVLTPADTLPQKGCAHASESGAGGAGSDSNAPAATAFAPISDARAATLGDLAARVGPASLPRAAANLDRRLVSQSRVWGSHYEVPIIVESLHTLCALHHHWCGGGNIGTGDDPPEAGGEPSALLHMGYQLVSRCVLCVAGGCAVEVTVLHHVGHRGGKRGERHRATPAGSRAIAAVIIAPAIAASPSDAAPSDFAPTYHGRVCGGLHGLLAEARARDAPLDIGVLVVQPRAAVDAPHDVLHGDYPADGIGAVAGRLCAELSLLVDAFSDSSAAGAAGADGHEDGDPSDVSSPQSRGGAGGGVRGVTVYHLGEIPRAAGLRSPLLAVLQFQTSLLPARVYEVLAGCPPHGGATNRAASAARAVPVLLDEGFLRRRCSSDSGGDEQRDVFNADHIRVDPGPVALRLLKQLRRPWEAPTAIYSGAELVSRIANASLSE